MTWQNQQSDCAPSEDSDQPGYPPSLIKIFAVRMKKAWVFSYPLSAQQRLWSDWADAQADLSLCWAHTHFVGFVILWLMHWKLPLMCHSNFTSNFGKLSVPLHLGKDTVFITFGKIYTKLGKIRPFLAPLYVSTGRAIAITKDSASASASTSASAFSKC